MLTDAYIHFLDYLRSQNLPPIKRRNFTRLVSPVVKEKFDLGVRHDWKETERECESGWKGVGILEPENLGAEI